MDLKLKNFIESMNTALPDAYATINTLEVLVNNFLFQPEKTAWEIIESIGGTNAEKNFRDIISASVSALANASFGGIDGRNEMSAGICARLAGYMDVSHPEIGRRFMAVHHTLQQTAMSLFFSYLNIRADVEGFLNEGLRKEVMSLREDIGEDWWKMPLI